MTVTNHEQPAESFTTIHRFELQLTEPYQSEGTTFEVQMPVGARVLTVEPKGIYAMVETDAELVTRRFFMISTGHKIARPDLLSYLVSAGGRHLFEILETKH